MNNNGMNECNVDKDEFEKGINDNEINESNVDKYIVPIEVGNDVVLVEEEVFQVEEECSKIVATLIQYSMSNYYFANDHKERSLFFIKLHQILCKNMETLTSFKYWKHVATFGHKDQGLIDFTKWEYDNIIENMQKEYSKSTHTQRVSMLKYIVISLNLSNTPKVFRVQNDSYLIS